MVVRFQKPFNPLGFFSEIDPCFPIGASKGATTTSSKPRNTWTCRRNLGGGLNQPISKRCSSNWIISLNRGENEKYLLKPPPRNWFEAPTSRMGKQKKHHDQFRIPWSLTASGCTPESHGGAGRIRSGFLLGFDLFSGAELLYSLKLTVRTWKWMVGILVSFWDGLFSGANC